ncbi:MAG: DUF4105 domain-containing protein [Bdellovibrionota bacterium]|nr:DUF4105 domain-containing protein [Bdellovibrionota bacterium]
MGKFFFAVLFSLCHLSLAIANPCEKEYSGFWPELNYEENSVYAYSSAFALGMHPVSVVSFGLVLSTDYLYSHEEMEAASGLVSEAPNYSGPTLDRLQRELLENDGIDVPMLYLSEYIVTNTENQKFCRGNLPMSYDEIKQEFLLHLHSELLAAGEIKQDEKIHEDQPSSCVSDYTKPFERGVFEKHFSYYMMANVGVLSTKYYMNIVPLTGLALAYTTTKHLKGADNTYFDALTVIQEAHNFDGPSISRLQSEIASEYRIKVDAIHLSEVVNSLDRRRSFCQNITFPNSYPTLKKKVVAELLDQMDDDKQKIENSYVIATKDVMDRELVGEMSISAEGMRLLDGLEKSVDLIRGLEIIVVDSGENSIEQEWGHAILRFVGEEAQNWTQDVALSLAAEDRYTNDPAILGKWKALSGGYKIVGSLDRLSSLSKVYLNQQERDLKRFVIPSNKNLILAVIREIRKLDADYYFLGNNCASALAKILKAAGYDFWKNGLPTGPFGMETWLQRNMISPYDSIVFENSGTVRKRLFELIKLGKSLSWRTQEYLENLEENFSKEELVRIIYLYSSALSYEVADELRARYFRHPTDPEFIPYNEAVGYKSIATDLYKLCSYSDESCHENHLKLARDLYGKEKYESMLRKRVSSLLAMEGFQFYKNFERSIHFLKDFSRKNSSSVLSNLPIYRWNLNSKGTKGSRLVVENYLGNLKTAVEIQ